MGPALNLVRAAALNACRAQAAEPHEQAGLQDLRPHLKAGVALLPAGAQNVAAQQLDRGEGAEDDKLLDVTYASIIKRRRHPLQAEGFHE